MSKRARRRWRFAQRAGMPFPVHPHMLRHACGYALANAGHDTRALQAWLGHKNIQHTVRYTELSPDRFNFRPSSASRTPAISQIVPLLLEPQGANR
jgi:site-specific recombinase XerD